MMELVIHITCCWKKVKYAFKYGCPPEFRGIKQKGRPNGRPFTFLLQILLYPLHRLNHILAMAEGRQAEEPFAAGAETGAGGADHVAFGEELVEELPAAHAARGLEPDVGGVHAAEAGDAGFLQTLADYAGVLHVIIDDLLGLLPPLVGVDRGGGALDRVGGAVELGGGAAQPELVEAVALAVLVVPMTSSGTTTRPQRTPVKPAVLEKERNSMAHRLAPSIS